MNPRKGKEIQLIKQSLMEKKDFKVYKPKWLNTVDAVLNKIAVIGFYALIVGGIAAFIFSKLKLGDYLFVAETIAVVGATLHVVIGACKAAMTNAYKEAFEEAVQDAKKKVTDKNTKVEVATKGGGKTK